MNAMDLLKALNDIDERFLIEHDRIQNKRKVMENKKNKCKLSKNRVKKS